MRTVELLEGNKLRVRISTEQMQRNVRDMHRIRLKNTRYNKIDAYHFRLKRPRANGTYRVHFRLKVRAYAELLGHRVRTQNATFKAVAEVEPVTQSGKLELSWRIKKLQRRERKRNRGGGGHARGAFLEAIPGLTDLAVGLLNLADISGHMEANIGDDLTKLLKSARFDLASKAVDDGDLLLTLAFHPDRSG